ncbi:hypothetical protein GCM10017322_03300 [Paracoccus aerius]|nr:hypothetical protein GCM10017322_03300 [Paracoccus aerius]
MLSGGITSDTGERLVAMTIELRAARLVASLQQQGVQVASLVVVGDEIRVHFVTGDVLALDELDLADMKRDKRQR